MACWLLAGLHQLRLVPLADTLALSLYQLYALAAFLGWLSGNVAVARRRHLPDHLKRRATVLWFVGPQGIPALLRAFAPAAAQAAAPLVPVYALGVGAVLFSVPLLMSRPPARRPFGE